MNSNTYLKVNTWVRLAPHEEWVTYTRDSHEFSFFVNQVHWDGGELVTITGPMLKRNGERGFSNRTDSRSFNELSEDIQRELKLSRSRAINELVLEESRR